MKEKHQDLPVPDALVIIVDDDVAVRSALRFFLEIEGFQVRAFAAASAVLEETELLDCCCLVIDQNMPGMCGIDLIDRLRDRKIMAPAILITTHPTLALKVRAENAGISIVEKPLLGNILLEEISRSTTNPLSQSH